MKINTYYRATGIVLGNYWGGGQGSYRAHNLASDDLDKLLKEAKQRVKDGSLDNGMGFESLIGARLEVTIVRTVEIETSPGVFETFTNDALPTIVYFVGDLTEKQQDFLDQVYFNG